MKRCAFGWIALLLLLWSLPSCAEGTASRSSSLTTQRSLAEAIVQAYTEDSVTLSMNAAPVGETPSFKIGEHTVRVGEIVRYTLEIQAGAQPVREMLLENQLPQGAPWNPSSVTFGAGTPAYKLCLLEDPTRENGNRIRWQISGLAPGERFVFSYTLSMPEAQAGSELINSLEIAGWPRSRVSEAVELEAPDIRARQMIAVLEQRTTPPKGLLFAFTIEVENQGNAEAEAVRILNPLPEGLHYIEGSAESTRIASRVIETAGQTSLMWQLPHLAPGAKESVTFQTVAGKVGRPLDNRAYCRLVHAKTESFPSMPGRADEPSAYAAIEHTAVALGDLPPLVEQRSWSL